MLPLSPPPQKSIEISIIIKTILIVQIINIMRYFWILYTIYVLLLSKLTQYHPILSLSVFAEDRL